MRKQLGTAPRGPFDAVNVRYSDVLEGDSAYEVAVKEGFVGTEEAWLASLEGDPGPGTPFQIITQSAWAALEFEDPGVLYIVVPD